MRGDLGVGGRLLYNELGDAVCLCWLRESLFEGSFVHIERRQMWTLTAEEKNVIDVVWRDEKRRRRKKEESDLSLKAE